MNKMKSYLVHCSHIISIALLFLIVGTNRIAAQGVGISESSITPDASAILELRSTTRGLLLPRLTTTNRDAITTLGMTLYNTTTNTFDFYNGSWLSLAPTASPTFTGTVTIPSPFTLGATSVTTTGTQLNYLSSATGTTGTTSSNLVFSASPTFTGTVTIPSPFTLGATSVTTTGTQLNYLSSATGTTGTTSSNLVFSTSPTLTTPTINGTISGTTVIPVANGGTGQSASLTAGGIVYGASTTAMGVTSAGTTGDYLVSGGTGAPTWSTPPTAQVYSTMWGALAATAAKAAAATILVTPIYIPASITVNTLRLRVTTALGATGDVGIYNSSGTRVVNGGAGSVTTAAGVKTVVVTPTTLTPGQYYVAVTWNSTVGVIAGANLGVVGAINRTGTTTGGGTVLPASITIGSITNGQYLYFVSLNN